jgi:PAS domain S-box-containing protein
MKLSQQTNILASIAVVAVVVVFTLTGWSAAEVRNQTEQITMAENTAKAISQFRYLIIETALYRERRTIEQWRKRAASTREMLSKHRYSEAKENGLLARERTNLDVIVQLYERLSQVDSAPVVAVAGNSEAAERAASTVSALFLTTQDMLDDAFELVRLNRLDLERSQNHAAALMLASIVMMAALIAAGCLIIKRRVLAPLDVFQRGINRVAAGDMSARVTVGIDNEIGSLAGRFNEMTVQLETSYAAVKAENAERRRAQQSLQEAFEQLSLKSHQLVLAQEEIQTIINHMPALVGYWDRDLRNKFGNNAYLEWFGITPAAMRGKHITEVIGAERFAMNKPFIEAALRGEASIFERTIPVAGGRERFSVASYIPDTRDGITEGFYVLVTDITPLKRAQQAQIEAQMQLRSVFDAASEISIIATGLDGTIQLFSVGAERMLGYTAAEMQGKATVACLHVAQEIAARGAALSLELGRPVAGFDVFVERARLGEPESREWTYRHKYGSTLPVYLTVTAVRDATGAITGFLGVAKDITQEKSSLEVLARARDAAEVANTAKSQFLANMSHEIRTPMNAILGMLQLLHNTRMTPLQRDYAGKSQAAAQSLLGLLNDILDFSKVESDNMTLESGPWRIDDLMRDLSVILSANVGEKEVEVLFEIDPRLRQDLQGDVFRLKQVLLNLASNAIKFTHHGEVVVRLQQTGQDADSTDIEFAVRDSGIGIAAEHLETIFEGFSQAEASTTRRFGGTGLGLAISQRLVRLMGGVLAVDSTPGVGSNFHFRLRFAHAAAAAGQSAAVVPAAPATGKPLRALIIDDNAGARAVLMEMVASLGWRGTAAASGPAALGLLEQSEAGHDAFDVILVDWKMPVMDGWEVTRRIRHLQHDGETPIVIMVTAHSRSMLAERRIAERRMVNGFLIKPVTASMLAEAVLDASTGRDADLSHAHDGLVSSRLAGLHLLVVDDNSLNQQVARELLANEGARVAVADGGVAAVQMVVAENPPFDAVLMDVQMPDMDGYQATRRIRQHPQLQSLPILAMTANVMAGDQAACLVAGMNGHIGKPIHLETLVDTLLRHCGARSHGGPTAIAPAGDRQEQTQKSAASISAPLTATAAPVIELVPALQRLGGNDALFVSLSRRFASDAPAMLASLRTDLVSGRHREAADTLHAFKSMAGTVGAASLARCAAALELQLQRAGKTVEARSAISWSRLNSRSG